MWIVIKYKSKNLNILKSNMIKKISVIPTYYCPKIKIHKYINNRLKEFEKILLEGYLLCYHKKFEDNFGRGWGVRIYVITESNNKQYREYILRDTTYYLEIIVCTTRAGSNTHLVDQCN